MLIYTENNDPDLPKADIHNVDTGITYMIEMLVDIDVPTPVVTIWPPGAPGARLYSGKQAVDFWNALLFRNPYSGTPVYPQTYLRIMLNGAEGEGENKSASTENEGLPF
ncbi:MAG: hypothetical protein KC410_19115 [Anaerolineales bacterium]|nr:hypothetical protein [Anaerolineales bacterium]